MIGTNALSPRLVIAAVLAGSAISLAASAGPASATELSFSANPSSLAAPGGPVTYRLDIAKSAKAGDYPIIYEHVDRVTDSVLGEIYPRQTGACSPSPPLLLACNYSVPFTGVAGDARTNTVTVNSGGDISTGPPFFMAPFGMVRQAVATVTLTPPVASTPVSRKKCKKKKRAASAARKKCKKRRV